MAEKTDFKYSPGWAGRWERFQMAMEQAGVERKARTFCVAWVRKFMAFLKPRSSSQSVSGDVERFFLLMAEEGRAGWQIHQRSELES